MGFLQRARRRSALHRGRWYRRGALGLAWAVCALLVGALASDDASAAPRSGQDPRQPESAPDARQALEARVQSVRDRWASGVDADADADAQDLNGAPGRRADAVPPKKWNKWSNWANWLNR